MTGNHDSVVSLGIMGQCTHDSLDRLQIVSVRSLRDQSTTQNHWTSLDPAIGSQTDSKVSPGNSGLR